MGSELVECMNEECGWSGELDETVHPKHDPENFLCPECHERIMFSETGATHNT